MNLLSSIRPISRAARGVVCLAAGLLCGCGTLPRGEYMALDFEASPSVRYRFVSSREVRIELTSSAAGKKEDSKLANESIEMVFGIRPLEANPYGLSTVEFTCESVESKRTTFSGKPAPADAMQHLRGRTYTLQVSPTGQIELTDSFRNLLREIGQKSFVEKGDSAQRIKDPDMILDWLFFQYTLWDLTASNPKPLRGIAPGSSWQSEQFLPWPVPIQNLPSRVITYTVENIEDRQGTKLASVSTRYQLREKPLLNFPLPYEGSYQIRGSLFSVLRSYRHESLEGTGQLVFNLTDGRLESAQDNYTLITAADFILPLGDSLPKLTVRQHIRIERLSDDNPQNTAQTEKNGSGQ